MEYDESEKGRCRTCGYLSRLRYSTPPSSPRYVEMGETSREKGEAYLLDTRRGRPERAEMACYRKKFPLHDEVREQFKPPAITTLEDAVLAVIGKDRKFGAWFAYTPDFDPKEHLQEWRMQELERMNRDIIKSQTRLARGQLVLAFVAVVIATAAIIFGIYFRPSDSQTINFNFGGTPATQQVEHTAEAGQETPTPSPEAP